LSTHGVGASARQEIVRELEAGCSIPKAEKILRSWQRSAEEEKSSALGNAGATLIVFNVLWDWRSSWLANTFKRQAWYKEGGDGKHCASLRQERWYG
jgi:hypothetical protein